ncbi:cell envelope biogenesis protein OmpA [Corallibacter sp.]|uniref:cell envelope biogenesis protein OmpA n=1 Tax=Corallibacter sp. TaxID=2038084 RepID=UPI003AB8339B
MNSSFINYKLVIACLACFIFGFSGFSQRETSKWKAQFALGINSPSQSGFVTNFEGKSINLPTVNLGLQHMLKSQFGVKLDYGFNRITNDGSSPYFKLNYSRVNAQAVYDASRLLMFLPENMGVVGHAGPGFSFVKPLATYGSNKTSFFNAMAGVEVHYGITQLLSVYFDASYIYGFSKDFDPVIDGYGSFNGNLLTATIGISISLSGCYYCD